MNIEEEVNSLVSLGADNEVGGGKGHRWRISGQGYWRTPSVDSWPWDQREEGGRRTFLETDEELRPSSCPCTTPPRLRSCPPVL